MDPSAPDPLYLTAVVLAAGGSSRMEGPNKLLLPLGSGTVLDGVLGAAAAGAFHELVVVTGRDAPLVERVARPYALQLPLRLVHNAAWGAGMGGSISAGVAAANARADGYAVFVGDTPFVQSETLVRLCSAFANPQTAAIVAPLFGNRRGHPVLFARAYRRDLLALGGDEGARRMVDRHAASIRLVATDDSGVVFDLDTPDAYRLALARAPRESDAPEFHPSS